LIKAGDELLRQVLIEAAHRLIRHEGRWRDMALRLRDKGKKTCVIVAAVANRWIRWLFHQMVERKSTPGGASGFLRHDQKSVVSMEKPSDAGNRNSPTPEVRSVKHFSGSVIP